MFTAPCTYVSNFVIDPDRLFTSLRDHLEWERRDDAPRCEYYCNDLSKPYVYGRGPGRRAYDPKPWTPAIQEIRGMLTAHTGVDFEVCFLNRYLDQQDHLGWHSDDSPEMDDRRPIAIISLGAEREIWFRPIEVSSQGETPEKLKLGHGSLCIMSAGMQNSWQHRIPKHSASCGERISLTFRGYRHP